MKFKHFLLLSSSVLALAACQNKTPASTPNTTSTPTHTQTHTSTNNTTYNQADHHDTRVHQVSGKTYLCENGFQAGISQNGSQLQLSVSYGMPKPATATLTRQNDGTYSSTTGLFGKGARWQDNGAGVAYLAYTLPNGRAANVSCRAE